MKASPRKRLILQEASVGGEGLPQTPAFFARLMGFRQEEDHDGEAREADGRYRPEDHAPAEERGQRASGQRREDRRDAEDEHGGGHQPGRLVPGMQIANDGARNHHGGAGADALQEAERDQGFDIGCKAAADPRKDEQRQAEIERRLAAESVGQRPVDDLADGDREEEAHQAHLHGADIDLELAGDGRERRQVHVDGKGPDGGQHAEDERVAQKGGLHRKRLS